jgi:hypothetical protein
VSNRDDGPGRVDWLDLGPDPDEGRKPADPRRRYLWYGAAAALVVLALVLTRTQHGTNRAATSPRSPSHTVSSSALSRTISSGSASSGSASSGPASSGSFVDPPSLTASSDGQPTGLTAAPRITSLGHPLLLDVPADWELFGWGPGAVVRIQLALGRITTTAVPVSGKDTLVVFVVGSDRAIVRSMDDITGYVVRDGKQATEVPPPLRQGAWMLPGPDQQHLWSDHADGEQGQLALLTLDGSPTGARIEVPVATGVLGSDSAGHVLLEGIGGVYDAQPGGAHRVTTGVLLAAGPTRWLTVECDDSLSCANVVIDRTSGARHTLNRQIDSTDQDSGTISPDGRTAAMLRHDGISASGIHLLDLDSGADRAVEVNPYSPGDQLDRGPYWAWSPDSRWLFATDAAGRVMIINRATGRATPLDTQLPSLDQLVLRHGAG